MTSCTVRRPAGPPILLFDSPHSGRHYPDDFGAKATRLQLRRGEDAYVDELLAGVVGHGVCLLAATLPRCYIDLNRAETDIDAALLAEPWPAPLLPTEKTRLGLGLIRRYVVPGVEIYGRRLAVREVQDRIALVYRPYHAQLDRLLEEIRLDRGVVWHVNWHSMKSVGNAMTPDGEGARRPDFVVSDLDGRSAEPPLTTLIVETLTGMGYTVSVNDPYKGGTIVQRVGDPARHVHSVQIEINRALYLDERAVEQTAGAWPLRRRLDELARCLASAAPRR